MTNVQPVTHPIRKHVDHQWSGHAEGRPLVFMHIPKTAGTSVSSLLQQWFREDEIMPPLVCQSWQCSHPALALAAKKYKLFGIGKHYDGDDILSTMRLIRANGLHPFLLACLREPRERLISQYFHWRRSLASDLEHTTQLARMAYQQARDLSLAQFLKCDNPFTISHFRNYQVRLFAGSRSSWMLDDEQMLDLALENASHFDLLGKTENLKDLLLTLSEAYGFYYGGEDILLNRAPSNQQTGLNDESEEMVEAFTSIDQRFWNALFSNQESRRDIQHIPSFYDFDWRTIDALLEGSTYTYSMVERLDGYGWHVREGLEHDTRWSGPGKESMVMLQIPPAKELNITLKVIAVIDWDIMNGMEVFLGTSRPLGEPELGHDGGYTTLTFAFRLNRIADKRMPLRIIVPFVKSHQEINPEWADPRKKGIAISTITVSSRQMKHVSPTCSSLIANQIDIRDLHLNQFPASPTPSSINHHELEINPIESTTLGPRSVLPKKSVNDDHAKSIATGHSSRATKFGSLMLQSSLREVSDRTYRILRLLQASDSLVLTIREASDPRLRCLFKNPLVSSFGRYVDNDQETCMIHLSHMNDTLGINMISSILLLMDRISKTVPAELRLHTSSVDDEHVDLLLRQLMKSLTIFSQSGYSNEFRDCILKTLRPELIPIPVSTDFYSQFKTLAEQMEASEYFNHSQVGELNEHFEKIPAQHPCDQAGRQALLAGYELAYQITSRITREKTPQRIHDKTMNHEASKPNKDH
ncbi:MAG: hypothetical protein VKO00_03985 [Cyanobacteriota bacterium]|nr:hypothetical protein [Cyanobacteriota bacterium]